MKKENSARNQKRLTAFFGGGSGSDNNDSSRADNHHREKVKKAVRKDKSIVKVYKSSNGSSRFGICPLCQRSFALHKLEAHASNCMGSIPSPATKPTSSSTTSLSSSQSSLEEDRISISRTSAVVTPSLRTPTCDTISYSEPIPGLFLIEDFISEQEETAILRYIDFDDIIPWKESKWNGKSYGKRWGVHCNLRDRRVDAPQHPLPKIIQDLIQNKLIPASQQLLPTAVLERGYIPNEANAIDYRRREGHWLVAHVDDRQLSKEPIANLSLAGDCIMTFRNERQGMNKQIQSELQKQECRVLLQRRTLQILSGKARYDYSHSIAHADLLTDRRVSITMRESPPSSHTNYFKNNSMATSTMKALPHYAWRKHQPKQLKSEDEE